MGGCRDLPEWNTAEDVGAVEAPEGERSVEVMWLRKGRASGKGGQVDARGSEVLRLRHGGRLREAGEDAQHGSVLGQETLVHPPQGLDLSQSRESLHRGGERYREGRTEKSMQGGRQCAKRDSYRHAPTHPHRQGREQ